MGMERLMVLAAEKSEMDAIEIRRVNTVDQIPISSPRVRSWDRQQSGVPGPLVSAMDLQGLREMQAEARRNGH